MKRPQFSLRLLLLITGLVAAIVGWRVAVDQENRALRNTNRASIEGKIGSLRINGRGFGGALQDDMENQARELEKKLKDLPP